MRTQTKTALLMLTAFLMLIALFSGFVYYAISAYSYDSFHRLLKIRAFTSAKLSLEQCDEVCATPMLEMRQAFLDGFDQQQEYVIPLGQPGYEEQIRLTGLPDRFFEDIERVGRAFYKRGSLLYSGIRYETRGQAYYIVAAAENYMDVLRSAYLRRVLVLAVVMTFLIAAVISFYFSKAVFLPIRRITAKVNQISSENLHLRLEASNHNDEVRELAYTFNDMLDRIETSFETQNNFISNASHELRTPLTAIIGEADVAMSKPRSGEEYVESLKVIMDEAEKLDSKTKALLFLAQTGFGGKTQKFDKVRIDQLLWDVKETIEKINPSNKVHIDMNSLPENPTKLKVKGSEQLLHLALSNVVNNACKYSGCQVVHISLSASDEQVSIVVKDTGIGIPAGEMPFIYDTFYRASNTKRFEGYGIGLPLTQNIVRMHSGEIQISSIEGQGTTVKITLPIGNYPLG